MSLLDEAMETFVFMNKTKTPDGYGGYTDVWSEGAEFQCAVMHNNTIEAKLAEKQGVTSVYTLTTSKALTLEYHDVVKRSRDQKIFRVTSDGDDVFTPASAGLDMRQVSAEEWRLVGEQRTGDS